MHDISVTEALILRSRRRVSRVAAQPHDRERRPLTAVALADLQFERLARGPGAFPINLDQGSRVVAPRNAGIEERPCSVVVR